MQVTALDANAIELGLMAKARKIIDGKRHDYSNIKSPYANFYACEGFGLTAVQGVITRICNKLSRLSRFAELKNGELMQVKDENLIDTGADLINYTCILVGLVMENLPEAQFQRLKDELIALTWS